MIATLEPIAPPAVASVPGEVLSASQASTFLGCAAKWWFRYGLGLPDAAGAGIVRGKAVHSIIGYYMSAKAEGIVLDAAGMADAYDHAWDDAAAGAEFAPHDDVAQLKASGRALVTKYINEAAPAIRPVGSEVPFAGTIGGVPVRGRVDILDADGCVIDIKTSSRRPSKISADHALQLATYAALAPGASGAARLDMLISTKDPQLIQIEHTPGAAGQRLVERVYPLVAEGIASGVYAPNRSSNLCSKRYCAYWQECEREFGGTVE